jgi:hypothetical protein
MIATTHGGHWIGPGQGVDSITIKTWIYSVYDTFFDSFKCTKLRDPVQLLCTCTQGWNRIDVRWR